MIIEKLELENKVKELMTVNDLDIIHFQQLELELQKSKELNTTLEYKILHLVD